MHQLEILKMLLEERKKTYDRLVSRCRTVAMLSRADELDEILRLVNTRLEKLHKTQNERSGSRG